MKRHLRWDNVFPYTLLFILLSSVIGASAQSLSGHITDSVTRLPVEGAMVYIPQLKVGAVTDKQGFYDLRSLPVGDYDVSVQSMGYARSFPPDKDQRQDHARFHGYYGLWLVETRGRHQSGQYHQYPAFRRFPLPWSLIA